MQAKTNVGEMRKYNTIKAIRRGRSQRIKILMMRMNLEQLERLLDEIAHTIQKQDTVICAATTARENTNHVLLSSNRSQLSLFACFLQSVRTICMPEILDASYEYLKDHIEGIIHKQTYILLFNVLFGNVLFH